MATRPRSVLLFLSVLLATSPITAGFASAEAPLPEAQDVDDPDDDDDDDDEDVLEGSDAKSFGPARSDYPSVLYRRGRRYDPLPKMDHFACKSDGLCIRPLGEKSLRVGLRSGESEVLVETLYAGDDKQNPWLLDQWCVRLRDRGLGSVATHDNGQCPKDWADSNDYPKFTPWPQIRADASGGIDLPARRIKAFAELDRLLASTPILLGKEEAWVKTLQFVRSSLKIAPFQARYDGAEQVTVPVQNPMDPLVRARNMPFH